MTQYACRTSEQVANFRRCVILGNCESFLIYLGGGMSVLCQFPFRAGGRGRGAMEQEQWGGRDILHNPGPGLGSITTSGKTHFLLTTLSRYTGGHSEWYTASYTSSVKSEVIFTNNFLAIWRPLLCKQGVSSVPILHHCV